MIRTSRTITITSFTQFRLICGYRKSNRPWIGATSVGPWESIGFRVGKIPQNIYCGSDVTSLQSNYDENRCKLYEICTELDSAIAQTLLFVWLTRWVTRFVICGNFVILFAMKMHLFKFDWISIWIWSIILHFDALKFDLDCTARRCTQCAMWLWPVWSWSIWCRFWSGLRQTRPQRKSISH